MGAEVKVEGRAGVISGEETYEGIDEGRNERRGGCGVERREAEVRAEVREEVM